MSGINDKDQQYGLYFSDMIGDHISPDVESDWQFTEVWIDPMLTPPYLLLLLADKRGKCHIYDPAKNYAVIFASDNYETAIFRGFTGLMLDQKYRQSKDRDYRKTW